MMKSERKIVLTEEQKKEILSSQREIKKGMVVPQEQLDEEINKWLKEK